MPTLTALHRPPAAGALPAAIGPDSEKIALYSAQSGERFYGASAVMEACYPSALPFALDIDRLAALFEPTVADLRRLVRRLEEQNGHAASLPDPHAVARAYQWIRDLFEVVVLPGLPWIAPNVNAGPTGEVEFEWWHNGKTLTAYISSGAAEYLTSWGPNIHSEMSEGDAESPSALRAVWAWLVGR